MEYINIKKYLIDFDGYLDYTDRAILSGKFGDGKTYFLEKFTSDEDYKRKYNFITLYPVNYQIQENKDIFELIKRDILIQMISSGMISEDFELSEFYAFQWYLINKIGLLSDIINSVSYILPDSNLSFAFLSILSGLKLFDKFEKDYQSFKRNIDSVSNDSKLLEYFKKFKKDSKYIYEYDAITKIISDNLSEYKKNNSLKNVLVIEDLDRLDPAHLFRILNIISAHIDRPYQTYTTSLNPYQEMKFGFDKILLVCDFENIRNVFYHFYGQNSNFEGYMSKFIQGQPFEYSLSSILTGNLVLQINKLTSIDSGIIEHFLDGVNIYRLMTPRIMDECLSNIDDQIIPSEIELYNGITITSINKVVRFFVIMKRIYRIDKAFSVRGWGDLRLLGEKVLDLFGPFCVFGIENISDSGFFFIKGEDKGMNIKVNYELSEKGDFSYDCDPHYYTNIKKEQNDILDTGAIIKKIQSYIK